MIICGALLFASLYTKLKRSLVYVSCIVDISRNLAALELQIPTKKCLI